MENKMNLDQADIKYSEYRDEEFIRKQRYFEERKRRAKKRRFKWNSLNRRGIKLEFASKSKKWKLLKVAIINIINKKRCK